jgi:hypothetical protein
MFDLQNYAQGWIDWNLLVDSTGGPNHLNNNCDACMVVNAQFTDVFVQPKYHFFGHISKFIPRGSVRANSHIVGDYQFEGVDPHIDAGIELGVYMCEKSSRQVWRYNADLQTIELKFRVDDNKYLLCIGAGDINREYLKLVDCTNINASHAAPALQFESAAMGGLLRVVNTSQCVALAAQVREPGALLQLTECKTEVVVSDNESNKNNNVDIEQVDRTDQLFTLDGATGELLVLEHYRSGMSTLTDKLQQSSQQQSPPSSSSSSSSSDGESALCVTAGWPFLTAIAFSRPAEDTGCDAWRNTSTAVVVMNEAPLSTSLVLEHISEDGTEEAGLLMFAIDASSIQTILY